MTILANVMSTEAEQITEAAKNVAENVAENPGAIKTYLEKFLPSLLSFGIQVVIAVLVLVIGTRIINAIVKMFKKGFARRNMEIGVSNFLANLIKYLLYFVLVMVILSWFGIATGSVVAMLGSAGLTIGLALQGSLSNFAGGVLILVLKPFKVGDYVSLNGDSVMGTVMDISMFYTKIRSDDNKVVHIPNGGLADSNITNFTMLDKRRIDISVGVAYDADLSQVKKVLTQVVDGQETVLKDEPVNIFVKELGDSAVDMGIRVWVRNEDFWSAKWKLTEDIKLALDENGISIPFPQMDVYVKKS